MAQTELMLTGSRQRLQPWTYCVGKWQKHEVITVIPIELVPAPPFSLFSVGR